MEITDEQIKKLIKIVGEKELIKIIPNIYLNYNEDKIYLFIGNVQVFKLHRVGLNEYAWTDLEGSERYANGRGTANEMIKSAEKDIKVFDNYREFVEWNYNNLTNK